MMKRFISLLIVGLCLLSPMLATNCFIKQVATGTKEGSSWGNAMSLDGFYAALSLQYSGDNFYFAGGEYLLTKVVSLKTTANIVSGFDTNLSGTTHDIFDYPIDNPTIFKGPSSDNGGRLLAVNTSTKDNSKPVTIEGAYFIDSSPAPTVTIYQETMAALFVDNSGKVYIKSCKFLNNTTKI